MQNVLLKGLTIAAALMGATVVWASVPQTPGFVYDTSFSSFTVDDCHKCHGQSNVDIEAKHHALLNNNPTGATLSCLNTSGSLPATFATGCHLMTAKPEGGFAISDPTKCLDCHTSSPHHTSTYAANQDCKHCHGSAIDNPLDGHYVPSVPMNNTITGFTPGPVGRTVPDPANPGKTIIVQGCEACHTADPAASPAILSNADTHHGTGIGQGAPGSIGQCQWCHSAAGSANSFTIRACEACHGVNSLHSVQYDSTSAANLGVIKPGLETQGFGHIGANHDCIGCHSSWTGSASSDMTLATVPAISGLSTPIVTAGKETNLTITGNSFINDNSSGSTTYTPVVVIKNGADSITLTPYSQTVSELKVALPATLQPGVYELRADKSGTVSNLVKLVVAPALRVDAAMLSGTTLTITGAGFGAAPTAQFKALLGVYVGTAQAKIVSWSDTKIVASSTAFASGKTISVKTLFGPASGTIFAAAKKLK